MNPTTFQHQDNEQLARGEGGGRQLPRDWHAGGSGFVGKKTVHGNVGRELTVMESQSEERVSFTSQEEAHWTHTWLQYISTMASTEHKSTTKVNARMGNTNVILSDIYTLLEEAKYPEANKDIILASIKERVDRLVPHARGANNSNGNLRNVVVNASKKMRISKQVIQDL